jgi:hypothetical protein
MDLSSLLKSLTQITTNDKTFIDDCTFDIISEMNIVSEEGYNQLSYDIPSTDKYLIQEVINRLINYFPDIIIKFNNMNSILIDWS